jgi:hypothetical protein
MGQTETQKIVRSFLSKLRQDGLIGDSAFAVLYGAHVLDQAGPHDSIEVILVSEGFGKNPVDEGRTLIAATWDVDPRISPTAASENEWKNALESPKLARAKANGVIVKS